MIILYSICLVPNSWHHYQRKPYYDVVKQQEIKRDDEHLDEEEIVPFDDYIRLMNVRYFTNYEKSRKYTKGIERYAYLQCLGSGS